MKKLFIENIQIKNKKVLLRADFNVPLNEDSTIADPTRLLSTLPSIQYILHHGGTLILMSHLGRPGGKVCLKLSLAPIAKMLSSLLDHPVEMATDCIGEQVREKISTLMPGSILLLENLRFHPAEEHPEINPSFAQELASYGEVYINDAFATSHRKHSSTYTIARYFPKKAAAGFLLKKEVESLERILLSPERPFFALLGGAKISTKMGVVHSLLKTVDSLIIGGGMSYTFLKAKGEEVGNSLVEEKFIPLAKELIKENDKKILLPIDSLAVDQDEKEKLFPSSLGISEGYRGMDIGPASIKLFCTALASAKTILWNGPLGVYEISAFAKGTTAIAQYLAHLPATTVIGGGDLIAAIKNAGVTNQMSFISTGGGATLEFIEHGTLPGIEALSIAESV